MAPWITDGKRGSSSSRKGILVGGALALSLAGGVEAFTSPSPVLHPVGSLRHAVPASSTRHRAAPSGASFLRASSRNGAQNTNWTEQLAPIWTPSFSKLPAKIAGAAAAFSLLLGGGVAVPLDAVAQEPLGVEQKVAKLDPAVEDKVQVFAEILNDINAAYVDPLDLDKITETGFNAMLQSLDPYTEFENPKATTQMRTLTTGNYGGVGLAISKLKTPKGDEEPYIYVMNSFEGYAFESGVRVGDKIVKVNGKDVKDLPVPDVSELLKGKQGTEVKVTFERNGKIKEEVLQRRQIPLRDVPLAMAIDDKNEIGYAKLSGFSSTAPFELRFVMGRLQAAHPLKALILDLRGNTGGLLSSAVQIADIFLPPDVNVVSTKGRTVETATGALGKTAVTPSKEVQYKSQMIPKYGGSNPDGSPKFLNEPLLDSNVKVVVLVDKLTASASEIVSGAIQDHDRGILIGETTYGKGLVQVLQRLSGGRQLKFTTAKYYTPSGRCIQAKTYAADGKGGNKESKIGEEQRTVFYTDAGRPVRDGGGVEPDVMFAPPKVGELESYLNRWDAFYRYAGVISQGYTPEKGEQLAMGSEPIVTDAMYADFQKWVSKQADPNTLASTGPFAKSLEIFTQALKESGFDEAVGDIKVVQDHLNRLMLSEFGKDKEQLMQRLESAVRSRYVVESRVMAASINYDKAIYKAVDILENDSLFAETLQKGRKAGFANAPGGTPSSLESIVRATGAK